MRYKDILDEEKLGRFVPHETPKENNFFKGLLRFIQTIGKNTPKNTLDLEFTAFDDIIIKNKMDKGRRLRAEKYLPLVQQIYNEPQFVAFVCCTAFKNKSVYRLIHFDNAAQMAFVDEYIYDVVRDVIEVSKLSVPANISLIMKGKNTIAGVITKSLAGAKNIIEKYSKALSIAKPKLINAVLTNSVNKEDFLAAIDEWVVVDWEVAVDNCICDRPHIHLGYVIRNTKTGEVLSPLGIECATLFKDPRGLYRKGTSDRNLTGRKMKNNLIGNIQT